MDQSTNSDEKEWDALYARARLLLDDDGVAQEDKRKEVAKKKLERAGLDVPQATLLLQELADLGYDLPRDALTPEEGAEALAKILAGRSNAL